MHIYLLIIFQLSVWKSVMGIFKMLLTWRLQIACVVHQQSNMHQSIPTEKADQQCVFIDLWRKE